jgi:hypothetical protein
MIKFLFDHPGFTSYTYDLAIERDQVLVFDPDGTPLGMVAKGKNGWEQTSGREFHHEMALAIGKLVDSCQPT